MTSSARFHLRLLGRFALTAGEGDSAPIRLSTRKTGALLAYLAMSPDQTASREELAALLWGSCPDQQARQSLRQALASLRKELGDVQVFTADTKMARLEPGHWAVDARDFETLARSSRPDDLERAGRLLTGAFLHGLNIDEEAFDEWLNAQRLRMQLAATRLCETYATQPELIIDGQQAVTAAEQLVALDPLREDWQRLALTLYARYRGRNEALGQAEAFVALLRRELDVAPEPETLALVERIRAGEIAFVQAEPKPSAVATPRRTEAPVLSLVSHDGAKGHTSGGFPSSPERWTIWSYRNIAAVLAIAAMIGIAAAFGPIRSGSVPARISDPVREVATAAPEPTAGPSQPPGPSSQQGGNSTSGQPSGVAAILVLPFTVAGEANGRSTSLADLMSGDLTNVLSRVGGFRIISRQTALGFRDARVDPAAVGAELGVRYLLGGSVEATGETLRASIELIEAKSRNHVWSARFERSGSDLPAIADEIVKSVGRELQVEVAQIESRRDTGEQDLHAMIYKGWAALSEARRAGGPALERAQGYFEQVLAREPNNTRAMTGLGASHLQVATQLSTPDPAQHLAKAEMLLKQVVARRPDVGGPSLYLGMVSMARGQIEAALAWFEREIARNPSQAAAYAGLGRILAATGRAEEGLDKILYAMRLSPRDPLLASWLEFAGSAELELGHYERAIAYLDDAVKLNAPLSRPKLVLIAAHALSGHPDIAQQLLSKLQGEAPRLSRDQLVGRFFGPSDKPTWPHLREGLRRALALSDDPWQSPRTGSTPSGDAAGGANKRIIPILVLPFMASGEATSQVRMIADMITDDLGNMLSRVASFRVISRRTARSVAEKQIDIAAVGAELQVRYVLEGTVRMQDGRLRVNVEVINPATRLAAWTGRIERDDADRRGVQDEIVGRLAREMQFEILPIESARLAKDFDADALAYRGWAALAAIDRKGYEEALSLFRQALERDPQNLSAQTGIGAYHARMGAQVFDTDSLGHRAEAQQILRDVIARDPQSSDAHFYLGLALDLPPTLPEALAQLARAIEIEPSNASAHAQIGNGLIRSGRVAEGLEHVRYAMRLSPRDPIMPVWLEFAGNAELELKDFSAAIDCFRRSTEINPGYPRGWAGLVAAHALAGHQDEARRYAEKLMSFSPDLTADGLVKQYGRHDSSRLREGLRLALAVPAESVQ
jgi:TolB-like protein/DNA-binding SARP family transcriptional activator/Tfp pilus assembly protein PilF